MKRLIVILSIALFVVGCEKDFLDINVDPNNPTEAPNNLLLPGVQVELARWFSIGDGTGSITAVYAHQITTREHWNDYGVLATTFYNQQNWQRLYSGVLHDLELMIMQGAEKEETIYAGIAKILKAYAYGHMVDLWADVPYSQAHNAAEFTHPAFDNGRSIYVELFALLDEALADLNNTEAANVLKPGGNDLIYNGDVNKWKRAANTLKLKLYNIVRKTDLFDQAAVNALLAGDLISSQAENMMLRFGTGNNPENRHPAFVQEYEGGQIGLYISPWFYQIMMGMNQNIFTGIQDPRVPYYFYNQLLADEVTQNPAEYIHDSEYGRFVSIWFGSTGPNRDFDQRVSASMVGLYPAGGRYSNPDDASADRLEGRSNSATGAVPQRFLTYADRLFIEAELIHAGKATGDAGAKLQNAIEAAFIQVDVVVDGAIHSTQDGLVPKLNPATNDATELYIDEVMAAYNAAGSNKKLEIIMTQKWISGFGSPNDPYTDYRRTGYPVIHDPNNDENQHTDRTRDYVVSFPWPETELSLNPNAPEQKVVSQFKVFWDVD